MQYREREDYLMCLKSGINSYEDQGFLICMIIKTTVVPKRTIGIYLYKVKTMRLWPSIIRIVILTYMIIIEFF